MVTNAADVLLQEYADCADPDRAGELLERLVVEHAKPGIRKLVEHQLAFAGGDDVDAVASEAAAEVRARLRANKDIRPFAECVRLAAGNACDEHIRRKHPNRRRVETRLRYLLSNEKGFAIWEHAGGEWLGGLARWQEAGAAPVDRQKLDGWRGPLQGITPGPDAIHPADMLSLIFERLGGPVPVADLATIVAELHGVDKRPASGAPAGQRMWSGGDPAVRIDLNRWMAELWAEIRELPPSERAAAVLGLHAPGGQSAVFLLPLTGAAGLREIAESLAMAPGELAALWSGLPLDDVAIAERLGATREQVAEWRIAARARLARLTGVGQ